MFKDQKEIWLYLIGTIILFGLYGLISTSYYIPLLRGDDRITELDESLLNVYDAPETIINRDIDYIANIFTNRGVIQVDLYENNAPENVNSFVYLSSRDFYNGTSFHRVVPGVLIQGGDRNTLDEALDNDGFGDAGYILPQEIDWESLGLSDEKKEILRDEGYDPTNENIISIGFRKYSLAVAAARPDVNGSQFFFVLSEDNSSQTRAFDGRFTNMGAVLSGSEILESISQSELTEDEDIRGFRPVEELRIENIEILIR